jgi:small GTP-binding protein
MENEQNKLKVVIVGNTNVGKSSILSRLVNNEYKDESNPTIGLDYFAFRFRENNCNIKLVLWDTAGQEQFDSIIKLYFKDIYLLLVIADINDSKSCKDIEKWIVKVINENKDSNIYAKKNIKELPILLIFNKIDLRNINNIQSYDCEKIYRNLLIKYKKIKYIEVSAKKNINIDKLEIILKDIVIDNYSNSLQKSKKMFKNNKEKCFDNICASNRYNDLDEIKTNRISCCHIT